MFQTPLVIRHNYIQAFEKIAEGKKKEAPVYEFDDFYGVTIPTTANFKLPTTCY